MSAAASSRIDIVSHNQYNSPGVHRQDLLSDGLSQLKVNLQWFDHALANGVHEPEAVNISTVDAHGLPNSRIVLSKSINELGVSFYTNYNSAKGQELSDTPFAALTYHWRYPNTAEGETQRQVRLRGRVVKAPSVESDEYFRTRSTESKLGAHASKQSTTLAPLSDGDDGRLTLQHRLDDMRNTFAGTPNIPTPDFWGGYILVPFQIEFWSGRLSRLHDRFLYSRSLETLQSLLPNDATTPIESTEALAKECGGVGWTIDRLSP
ncbi:hypothetical protein E3P99_03893 [Wallemia hederae]|uniref:pyridoxal 5'-phosphate synthase n=1 Tax=Wallemia hederae TaxID=1540922 RepID=A0A4T0FD56_9BASI|nr:hypothetical protein E3P99_03893 [Wallemia hederae]